MLWRREQGWTYELHPLDKEPEVHENFSSLHSLWESKRIDGKLPKWSDFEMKDFKDWWGWLIVYDFEDDDWESVRVRLWGSHIAEYMGYDASGKLLEVTDDSGIIDAQHITLTDMEFHRVAAETRKIAYSHGPVQIELSDWQHLYDLGLPLANDGERIDKLLYGTYVEHKV
jgi:hypothetical protein